MVWLQENMNNIKVSVITVGMNHLKYIKNLYRTLLIEQRPLVNFEAIYVDNCSTDGSQQWLRKTFPEVRIIQNEHVRGFGANNNIGVKASCGEYIAIINPDIEILDHAIDRLLSYADKNKDQFGLIAPKLLNPDEEHTVQYSVRHFITLGMFVNRFLSKGNDDSDNTKVCKYLCKNLDTTKVQQVNWAMGAALFLTRNFYAQLDGFDQDYFLYMEDEDICLRSWKIGKPVIYHGEIAVIHNHLRGSSKIGKKMLRHFQSLFIFFRKHGINVKSYV